MQLVTLKADPVVSHQAKIQKHQAFEAEVAAHTNAIVTLDNTGTEMINQGHFASETIRQRLGKAQRLERTSGASRRQPANLSCVLLYTGTGISIAVTGYLSCIMEWCFMFDHWYFVAVLTVFCFMLFFI